MNDVVLRRATPSDAERLATTIRAAFAQYRGRLAPESGALAETAGSLLGELAAGAGAVVAERDGVMLGCVMVREEDGDLYVGRLAVRPAARGLGLARRLVAAVEDEASRRGLAGVRLGVRVALPDNQRLFAGLGYVEVWRGAHPGFDHPTRITMRKALPPSR